MWCFTERGSREHAKFLGEKRDDHKLGNAAKHMAAILMVVRLPQLLKKLGSHNQDNRVPRKSTWY